MKEDHAIGSPGPEEASFLQYHEVHKSNLRKPMAVVAFPTVGLSGVIAAQFLVEKLRLPLLGSLWSHSTPPTAVLEPTL